MVRTQVQLPDELHQAAKRIADEQEITFTEVVRRGLEYMVTIYPPRKIKSSWHPPKPRRLGKLLAPPEEWRLLANERD